MCVVWRAWLVIRYSVRIHLADIWVSRSAYTNCIRNIKYFNNIISVQCNLSCYTRASISDICIYATYNIENRHIYMENVCHLRYIHILFDVCGEYKGVDEVVVHIRYRSFSPVLMLKCREIIILVATNDIPFNLIPSICYTQNNKHS